MNDMAKCLREIDKVKEVAEGGAPYAARSRIARLTLNTTRLVCSALGAPAPDRPLALSKPVGASSELTRVIDVCNRLNSLSKSVAQPSEPLEQRWRKMWAALLADLDELAAALRDWNRGAAAVVLVGGGNRHGSAD